MFADRIERYTVGIRPLSRLPTLNLRLASDLIYSRYQARCVRSIVAIGGKSSFEDALFISHAPQLQGKTRRNHEQRPRLHKLQHDSNDGDLL
jgi:hypothetical protein